MKIGDLVQYIENDMGGAVKVEGQEGLIIDGPQTVARSAFTRTRWQVYWVYCNKIGWWDEFRLEVINESQSR